jgi:hypothetical protein
MHQTGKTRREFLSRVAGLSGQLVTSAAAIANNHDDARRNPPADVTLRVTPVRVEVAPGRIIHTVRYNEQRPAR